MEYLYDVFALTEQENIPDLSIGLAHFIALHSDKVSLAQYRDLTKFITRNYAALVEAFRPHDREHFNAVVSGILAKTETK